MDCILRRRVSVDTTIAHTILQAGVHVTSTAKVTLETFESKGQQKIDANRRAVGMLNPSRDKIEDTYRGGEGMSRTSLTVTPFNEFRWKLKVRKTKIARVFLAGETKGPCDQWRMSIISYIAGGGGCGETKTAKTVYSGCPPIVPLEQCLWLIQCR